MCYRYQPRIGYPTPGVRQMYTPDDSPRSGETPPVARQVAAAVDGNPGIVSTCYNEHLLYGIFFNISISP